jgi:hypothetical protein
MQNAIRWRGNQYVPAFITQRFGKVADDIPYTADFAA